jgi:hypothetical protein
VYSRNPDHTHRTSIHCSVHQQATLVEREKHTEEIRVYLIDVDEQSQARYYWFFPERDPTQVMPDLTKEILDDATELLESLPDGMDDEFREQINRTHRIGDPIDEEKQDLMIRLSIDALNDSDFAWAGEMLDNRQGSAATHQQSGVGLILVYIAICLPVSTVVGLSTWIHRRAG